MLRPKLNIIIPVFNGEQYISRCIESLINQSLKDTQITVVDDGSKDDTIKIIQAYMALYPNIKLIAHSENKGTGSARNTGLESAVGVYVAFLDADDWMDTNGYMEMMSALEDSSSDIAVCNVYTEYGSPYLSQIRYSYPCRNTITGKFALRLLSKTETQDSYMSSRLGNKVFRRELLLKNNIRFAERSIWEDVNAPCASRRFGCRCCVYSVIFCNSTPRRKIITHKLPKTLAFHISMWYDTSAFRTAPDAGPVPPMAVSAAEEGAGG